MARIGQDEKQPHEILDFDVDFADWMPAGDGIDYVQTEVRLLGGPQDQPLTVDRVDNTRVLSKLWLSGGADGAKYRVQVRASTLMGRKKEAEFDLKVKEI